MKPIPRPLAALSLALLPLVTGQAAPIAPPLNPHHLPAGFLPWHLGIQSTVFYVGEPAVPGSPSNARSAWDGQWQENYGGVDSPGRREGFLPAHFVPFENPFYVALPYCDLQDGQLRPEAAVVVPWFRQAYRSPGESVCAGRWVEIRHGSRVCYAQWMDVGPYATDDWPYVFFGAQPKPHPNNRAGIDVSPAVRDYLGLSGLDVVDWKFSPQIPMGLWAVCRPSTTAKR